MTDSDNPIIFKRLRARSVAVAGNNASDLGLPSRDDYYGYGRIDVLRTLTAVAPGVTAVQAIQAPAGVTIDLPAVVR